MIKNLYSVYDSKSATFCNPFTEQNDQTATRSFAFAANDLDNDIGRYPSDYTLFRVASFNFETGLLVSESTPINIALAYTLIRGE